MLERRIADKLEQLYPRLNYENGDWEATLDAALRPERRPARRSSTLRRGRHVALAAGIAVALVALAVVPALAVSQGWWFLASPYSPQPLGPVVVAIEPTPEDSRSLVAFLTDERNGRIDICYSLTTYRGAGSAMACGLVDLVLGGSNRADASGQWTLTSGTAYGPASLDVASVEGELEKGRVVEARMGSVPEELGMPLRFFVLDIPKDETLARIVGKDRGGNAIGTITLPKFTKHPPG